MRLGQAISSAMMTALLIPLSVAAQPVVQLRLLTVSGKAEVKAKPDQATLSAGVVTEGKTAAAALAANSRAMNAVFDTLKRLGIPDRGIQTSEISVQPQYPNDSRAPRRITGYQASNSVTVTLDNIEKLGSALDALVSSGANSLGDISFGLRDPRPLESQARADAVRDAAQKAEGMARAAGVSLGPIVAINEGETSQPVPMRRMAPMALAEATPVAAGQETITATVTISWEIR
ncbi:MAG TPA: SIMPL domain-containing protein [Rhizomicrobium sp.]|nr:SIMPL domain-containing protein [Rhizomicrobium sp.]